MRIKFAQALLEGYQFLFGPDVEFDDGSVRDFSSTYASESFIVSSL